MGFSGLVGQVGHGLVEQQGWTDELDVAEHLARAEELCGGGVVAGLCWGVRGQRVQRQEHRGCVLAQCSGMYNAADDLGVGGDVGLDEDSSVVLVPAVDDVDVVCEAPGFQEFGRRVGDEEAGCHGLPDEKSVAVDAEFVLAHNWKHDVEGHRSKTVEFGVGIRRGAIE